MTQFTQAWVDAQNAKREPRSAQPATASDELEFKIQAYIAAHLKSIGAHYVRQRMDKKATCKKGTPDFTGTYRGIPFGIEVKRKGQKPTVEQQGELLRIRMAGGKTAVVWSLIEAVEFMRGIEKQNI